MISKETPLNALVRRHGEMSKYDKRIVEYLGDGWGDLVFSGRLHEAGETRIEDDFARDEWEIIS